MGAWHAATCICDQLAAVISTQVSSFAQGNKHRSPPQLHPYYTSQCCTRNCSIYTIFDAVVPAYFFVHKFRRNRPAVPAQDLMPWVLCEFYETIRCKHYRTVWQVRIADDKVLLNPFYSCCQIQRNTRECLGRSHALANHTALLLFCFLQVRIGSVLLCAALWPWLAVR